MNFIWGTASNNGYFLSNECANIGSGGCTSNGHNINFKTFYRSTENRSHKLTRLLNEYTTVHELTHAFANLFSWQDPDMPYNVVPDDPLLI